MIHRIGRKSRSAAIFLAGVLLLLCAACAARPAETRTVQTPDYSVSVPKDWETPGTDAPELTFSRGDRQIGGVRVLRYVPGESFDSQSSSLFGNHVSRILDTEALTGTELPAQQALLQRNWNENSHAFVSYELHVYYLPGDKVLVDGGQIAYDLYLDTGRIDTAESPDLTELSAEQAKKKLWELAGLSEESFRSIVESFRLKA